MTTETLPRFAELETYDRLREQFLGEPMPGDHEATAERPLPEAL